MSQIHTFIKIMSDLVGPQVVNIWRILFSQSTPDLSAYLCLTSCRSRAILQKALCEKSAGQSTMLILRTQDIG